MVMRIELILYLCVENDALNLIKNAVIIDKGEHYEFCSK